jgi:Ca2+-binding RTX toxin-like protein
MRPAHHFAPVATQTQTLSLPKLPLVVGALLCISQGCLISSDDYGEEVDAIDLDDDGEPDELNDKPLLCQKLRSDPGLRDEYKNLGYDVIHWEDNSLPVSAHYLTHGPYIIFGNAGRNTIIGSNGDDIICAGGQADVVEGGLGQDRIYGEGGNDILRGGNGGDWIHGGPGNDEIYGDLLDDKLFGDEDDDLIIGGHGVDYMYGGKGDDWLRGDTNEDAYVGGHGYDVASFATARPTGHNSSISPRSDARGVQVVLNAQQRGRVKGDGVGDASADFLQGIERVIGSAFNDKIRGGVDFRGIHGNDCIQPCMPDPDDAPQTSESAVVLVDRGEFGGRSVDAGVIILGTSSSDVFHVNFDGSRVLIHSNKQLTMMDGCTFVHGKSKHHAACYPGSRFRYLMAWGGNGDDNIMLGKNFPIDVTAHLDGGEGNDRLQGSDVKDVLFTGRTGMDELYGGLGDDALISETYSNEKKVRGGGGSDLLVGGGGSDQLVSDNPCGNHRYWGDCNLGNEDCAIDNGSFDIAGFARVGDHPIRATLGGNASLIGGPGFNNICGPDSGYEEFATSIANDLEVLEGSNGDDYLYGNGRPNVIWGRAGDDFLYGLEGNDFLEGHAGNDHLYGGPGNDELDGGSGDDTCSDDCGP